MLTESERAWLGNRKPGDWCVTHDCSAMFEGECISVTCYMDISWLYRDAAEFSERVAAKLANIHFGTEDCEYCSSNIRVHEYCGECHTADDSKHCQDCRLKAARLQVEEEMDADI